MEPDWDKGGGLLPAVVQDAEDGRVLMLGYMNAASLERTHESGLVTFYSRSRETLWTKGETSGNTLRLVSVHLDCDRDTLLVRARPSGPVCHRLTPTCFDDDPGSAIGFLSRLDELIAARTDADPADSYTARLLAGGLPRVAQKVGEEGVETALAGALNDASALTSEAADLIYHLLVLLRAAGTPLRDVLEELEARHASRG